MKVANTEETTTRFKIVEKSKDDFNPGDEYEIIKRITNKIGWLGRELEYAQFCLSKTCKYKLVKGDVFEVDWGCNINAELSNRHYGVVLVDSAENNPLVVMCPLKSKHKEINPSSDLELGKIPGLNCNESVAVINQIRTIDKTRLYTKQIINYDMEHEVSLKMPMYMVNKIKKAYHQYITSGQVDFNYYHC